MEIAINGLTVKKVIESGHNQFPLVMAYPDVSTEDMRALKKWYWNDVLNEDPTLAFMNMYWHSYVLECNGKNLLIDACVGNHKQRPFEILNNLETPYLGNLAVAGFAPEDIDYVLCTHLHHDHVGWFTKLENGKWVPTFTNAKYVFTRADYEKFSDYHGEDPSQRPAFYDSILPIVEHDLAELIDTDHVIEHELAGGVWFQGVPGHTPGNCVIHAGSHGRSDAIFTGDVFHHPIEIARPLTRFANDDDPAVGSQSRFRFFDQFADSSAIIFPAHFLAGKLLRDQATFRYQLINGGGQAPLEYAKCI